MKKKQKNKTLQVLLIILLILLLLVGVVIGIVFLTKNREMKYYNVSLSNNTGSFTLSLNSNKLAPNSDIITRPITINLNELSENAFVRVKVIFENDSEDDRVLSFVSQLNYFIDEIQTFQNENYSWQYFKDDNCFYLMNKTGESLRTITKNDSAYTFVESLKVSKNLEQLDVTNYDGNNVQIGEDVTLKVIFEAVQSSLSIKGNIKIEDVREYFNNFFQNQENNFTSVNGFITSYSGNAENLTLPKYVGKDYIIGVEENVFSSSNLKKLIIPGNYIYLKDNAFYNSNNLTFVYLTNQANLSLSSNTFSARANLEIYAPYSTLNFIKNKFSTYNYVVNLKQFTQVDGNDISSVNDSVTNLYLSNATEIEGNLKNLSNLKAIYAPNLTKINANMFESLTNLVVVDCPNVLNIESYAFNGCSSLYLLSVNKNLEEIGSYSFANCRSLENVSFISNLATIPTQAFRNCSAIKTISLKNNVEILNAAFYNDRALTQVNIFNLKTIEDYAFGECNSLNIVNILGVNNLNLSNKAFSTSSNSNSLTNIVFTFNNANVKNQFNQLTTNLNYIIFTVSNSSLNKAEGNIRNLNLTNFYKFYGFTKIGDKAFSGNTSLVNLSFSNEIVEVGSKFVENVSSLNSITINSSIPPKFSETAFTNANQNLTILVPADSLNLYKATLQDFEVQVVSN